LIGASLEASQRRQLDSGRLGVFALSTKTGADAAKLLTLSAVGQRRCSPSWHEFTTEEFEIRSRSGVAFAGIDGEALELATPLRFRLHPGGLRLFVPAGNLEEAERRRAGDVDAASRFAIAAGREPTGTPITRFG
jgi:diacylglycerol kinase family enzyme